MRVKTGTTRRARHKKTLKSTKGYRLTKSKLYKAAHEAQLHAGQYAFVGRKQKKRNFKTLWISRINAALTEHNLSYSSFMNQLKKTNIGLNRKILANLAVNNPDVFNKIVKEANKPASN
ncbi:MAG: 50S ribosomal protein L20 [Candidatus Shapirobacteria bacterium]|nr:50S ribosomal protein L20 [Candidatus Shapirobacteria bacterium]MDD5073743.1 50S ribosomal protein L20 [Candidatus Shapirobacteria bacterium]